jgi:hypothetical protein
VVTPTALPPLLNALMLPNGHNTSAMSPAPFMKGYHSGVASRDAIATDRKVAGLSPDEATKLFPINLTVPDAVWPLGGLGLRHK